MQSSTLPNEGSLQAIATLCSSHHEVLSQAAKITHSNKTEKAAESVCELGREIRSINLEKTTVAEIRDMIARKLIRQSTRNQIGKICPILLVDETDIKALGVSECVGAIETAGIAYNDRMSGTDYYHQFITEEDRDIRRTFNDAVDYRLKSLSLKFNSLSPEIHSLIYMLFASMQQPPHERLETIKFWLKSFDSKPGNRRLLQNFMGVYADVSQYLLQANPSGLEVQKARLVLAGVLEDKRLADSDNFNPFEVLTEYLSEENSVNPWISEAVTGQSDTAANPFDLSRVGDLVSTEVPRELLAASVAGLNQYGIEVLNQRASVVMRQYEAYQNLKRAIATGDNPEGSPERNRLIANLRSTQSALKGSLGSLFGKYKKIHPKTDMPDTETGSQIAFIRKNIIGKAQWKPIKIESSIDGEKDSTFHPLMIMLRLIDAEKIASNLGALENFKWMLQAIEPLIASLYEDIDSEETEECGAALARSVDLLLNSGNDYLNVLLRPDYKHTVRSLVLQHIVRHIPSEIRNNGAYANFKDKARIPADYYPGPLVIAPDSQHKVYGHFNSAMEGIERSWIVESGRLWCEVEREAVGDFGAFERIMEESTKTLKKYFGAKRYTYHYYSSATDAAIDVYPKLVLHEAEPDDYIIGSNQEYSAFVDEAVNVLDREAPTTHSKRAEFLEFNRDRNKPKTGDDILADIIDIIERRGRPPRMLLLSTKTRYGDAAAIHSDPSKSNYFGLELLIGKIRELYPTICIVLDGCQSFSRNDIGEEIGKMNPDIFFVSSAKAGGVHDYGAMLIREDFRGYPEAGKKRKDELKNTRSTVNLRGVAATTIALKHRMSNFNTWAQPIINPEGRSNREVTAEQYRILTENLIQSLSDFGEQVALEMSELHPVITEGDLLEPFSDAMQAEVLYPVHRKRRDYNGILSVGFPGIKGQRLVELLSQSLASGPVTICGKNKDAIRISFTPSDTVEDIDKLMTALKNAVLDEFKRQLNKIGNNNPKIKADLELWLHKKRHNMPDWEN